MQRDFLKELGIDEEVINKIMAENGKDIEKEKVKHETQKAEIDKQKGELEAVKTELESAKEQLTKANETINGFGDVEAIKVQVADYKTKFEASEVEAKTKLDTQKAEYETMIAEMAFDNKLKEMLSSYKFSSPYAQKGIFDEIKGKGLKREGDNIIGFEDVLKSIQEANPTAFIVEQNNPQPPTYYGSAGKTNVATPTETEAMREQFKNAQKLRNTAEMSRLTRVAQEKNIQL